MFFFIIIYVFTLGLVTGGLTSSNHLTIDREMHKDIIDPEPIASMYIPAQSQESSSIQSCPERLPSIEVEANVIPQFRQTIPSELGK